MGQPFEAEEPPALAGAAARRRRLGHGVRGRGRARCARGVDDREEVLDADAELSEYGAKQSPKRASVP